MEETAWDEGIEVFMVGFFLIFFFPFLASLVARRKAKFIYYLLGFENNLDQVMFLGIRKTANIYRQVNDYLDTKTCMGRALDWHEDCGWSGR